MKSIKIKLTVFVCFMISEAAFAQNVASSGALERSGFREAGSLLSKQKVNLLKEFRENSVITELDIPEKDRDQFKGLYSEYLDKQREIKEKFTPVNDYESLSDREAEMKLQQSFLVGQELLDNRKEYADRFKKIVRPQKVLKMFQTEGRMRDKMLQMKNGGAGFRGAKRKIQEP